MDIDNLDCVIFVEVAHHLGQQFVNQFVIDAFETVDNDSYPFVLVVVVSSHVQYILLVALP